MKGIVLAGGLGTRLSPCTLATNKHLLPIYDRPMIHYPLKTLVDGGITDILIVTGGPHAGDFIKVLRNGEDFGLNRLHYAYQEGEGGIAHALSMAESFVGSDDCAVVLGDNLFTDSFSGYIDSHSNRGGGVIFTKRVDEASRFGVVEYSSEGESERIVEKPKNPPSQDAVTGMYLYDNTVFNKIKSLGPSDRGEL